MSGQLLESPAEYGLRRILRDNVNHQFGGGKYPPLCLPTEDDETQINDERKNAMALIDPQEFGELKAQVRMLLQMEQERSADMRAMTKSMDDMRQQMAEARGGWKFLMLLGGSASALGSLVTWFFAHPGPRP
jgi:hypothetical protein